MVHQLCVCFQYRCFERSAWERFFEHDQQCHLWQVANSLWSPYNATAISSSRMLGSAWSLYHSKLILTVFICKKQAQSYKAVPVASPSPPAEASGFPAVDWHVVSLLSLSLIYTCYMIYMYKYVKGYVCLSVCLSVVCLSVCLAVCLLSACLPGWLSVCVYVCMYVM